MFKLIKEEQEQLQSDERDITQEEMQGTVKTVRINETVDFIRVMREIAKVAVEACYIIEVVSVNEREVIKGQLETMTRATETIREVLNEYMPGINESINTNERNYKKLNK